jgi:hypothetical protein
MSRGRCLIGANSDRPSSLSAGGASRAQLFNVRVDVSRAVSGRSWRIVIYYTTRGLKILDYTRRVARKHHEIEDRVVFPATRRVIENFPSSSCIRVDYIMNKINK